MSGRSLGDPYLMKKLLASFLNAQIPLATPSCTINKMLLIKFRVNFDKKNGSIYEKN